MGGRNFLFLFMLSLLNLGAFCWDSIVGVEKGGGFFSPPTLYLYFCVFGSWKVDSTASSLTEFLPFSSVSYFRLLSFPIFPVVLILVILYPFIYVPSPHPTGLLNRIDGV